MGYFLDIHKSSNRAQGVALTNEWNGVQGSDSWKGELAVSATNSVFQFIFSNVDNWAGDSNTPSSNSPDGTDDNKKQELETQKTQLLNQLPEGAPNDSSQFNNYLNTTNNQISALDSQITTHNQTISTTERTIAELEGQIAGLSREQQSDEIQRQIQELQNKIEQCNQTIQSEQGELHKAEANKTELTETYKNAQATMEKIVNIEKQIQSIENGGVQEKAKKMKSFTEALQAWKNAPEGSDKKALAQDVVNAFEKMGDKVSPSTIKLYQLYDQDLNNDINGTKADIYKEKEAKAKK